MPQRTIFTIGCGLVFVSVMVGCVPIAEAEGGSTFQLSRPPTSNARVTPTTTVGRAEQKRPSNADERAKKRAGSFDDYQLPVGTVLPAQLRTAIGSASSRVGDQIRATVSESVDRDGIELLPEGSSIHGKVTDVVPASSREPRGRVAVTFYVIQHARTGSRASVQTRPIVFEASDREAGAHDRDAPRSSRKQPRDVRLGGGELLTITLMKPLTVRIPK